MTCRSFLHRHWCSSAAVHSDIRTVGLEPVVNHKMLLCAFIGTH